MGAQAVDSLRKRASDLEFARDAEVLTSTPTSRVAIEREAAERPSSEARFDERMCPDGMPAPDVRCGFLDVPESRSRPEGRRVRIAVSIRQQALSRNDSLATGEQATGSRRAIVMLAGGPGGPLLDSAQRYQEAMSAGGADVIVLDQRGSGRSSPSLACQGLEEALRVPAPEDLLVFKECLVRHLLRGLDVAAFSTHESAADIEDLRRVLDYDTFDLVGQSYGTRLALEVARAYPEGVRSIVLAGPAPMGSERLVRALEVARIVDELEAVCQHHVECRAAYGPLDGLLVRAMNLAGERGGSMLVANINTAIFNAAYSMDGVLLIPKILALAAEGDWIEVGRLLPALSEVHGSQPPSRSPADLESNFSIGLNYSVNCADEVHRPAAEDGAAKSMKDRLLAAGASWSYITTFMPDGLSWCSIVGVAELPDEFREPVTSDVPVLVLSGRFDPVTPPRFGDAVARTLSRAQVVVAPHLSHSLILQDACVDSIVKAFLIEPGEAVDSSCLQRAAPGNIALP